MFSFFENIGDSSLKNVNIMEMLMYFIIYTIH